MGLQNFQPKLIETYYYYYCFAIDKLRCCFLDRIWFHAKMISILKVNNEFLILNSAANENIRWGFTTCASACIIVVRVLVYVVTTTQTLSSKNGFSFIQSVSESPTQNTYVRMLTYVFCPYSSSSPGSKSILQFHF